MQWCVLRPNQNPYSPFAPLSLPSISRRNVWSFLCCVTSRTRIPMWVIRPAPSLSGKLKFKPQSTERADLPGVRQAELRLAQSAAAPAVFPAHLHGLSRKDQSGINTVKTEPFLPFISLLRTRIRPPYRVAICAHPHNPSPVPVAFFVLPLSRPRLPGRPAG